MSFSRLAAITLAHNASIDNGFDRAVHLPMLNNLSRHSTSLVATEP